ncbi:MAG: DUF1989 domain-containing protein [bacterium]
MNAAEVARKSFASSRPRATTMRVGVGMERHRVAAMGLLALPLRRGDAVEIVDPEGLQVALVAAFDSTGEARTGALGLARGAATERDVARMARCLRRGTPDARRLAKRLRGLGIDLAGAEAVALFGGESAPGASASLRCEADALCLICAPGEDMEIARPSPPPSELIVLVRRADGRAAAELPEPWADSPAADATDSPSNVATDALADPRDEIRIARCTAVAYEIKVGEYIQVIDVEGRQCSDFQCFDLAQLELGRERCLDATATRTLMGADYPRPGLHSKFYDFDFAPLVEVVQDTCGRHDSFGLACTPKFYDDAGYPGHVNCSDNFNRALAPYEIAPRGGWMAMNLFFNTFFDHAHRFAFDAPWSRAGDYVLLRALKDMVCVSSACPDDIDQANGWNPTDIHVRLYPRGARFKRALAFRKTAHSEIQMTKETGFHSRTSTLTRDFTEYSGYWLANSFANLGDIAEYWACREGVVVTDLSPLRKAEVTGPDAERLVQTCVTRDIRRLSAGQVVYTAMCNQSGGMIDDGTVFRLGKDNLRWVGGSDDSTLQLQRQASELNLQAWVKDSTDQLHNLQVQGPRSVDVLREVIWTRDEQTALDELEWFRFSIARIGGEQGAPVLVSRTGYTGERGYEVFCHPKHAEPVWDAIWSAGQAFDIKPLGLAALDILRIEAGLIFAGYEFSDQTDPFEAGIGFTVALSTKQDDFIGRDALAKRKANPQRKLVGLEVQGEEPAAHDDGVYAGASQVGVVTSGVISPTLRKNIALCRMNIEHTARGETLEIGKLDGHQKRIPCEVVSFPHYDPKKERVK